jgi:hypothetical protein
MSDIIISGLDNQGENLPTELSINETSLVHGGGWENLFGGALGGYIYEEFFQGGENVPGPGTSVGDGTVTGIPGANDLMGTLDGIG